MSKRLWMFASLIVLEGMAAAQPLETREVSNQIERPGCSLDVAITTAMLSPALLQSDWAIKPPDVVVDVRMRLNGNSVEVPPGFSQALQNPTRIVPLHKQGVCGFRLEQGDASTSSVLEVTLQRGRVRKLERFDIEGRTTSITTFKHPGIVVLD